MIIKNLNYDNKHLFSKFPRTSWLVLKQKWEKSRCIFGQSQYIRKKDCETKQKAMYNISSLNKNIK